MSKYKPYPAYKDSGIEWLGKVPEQWEVSKHKYNFNLRTDKTKIEGQQVIALENIESWSGKYLETDSSYTGQDVTFESGDILFGKLRPYLAKVYQCKNTGIGFGDILVYQPKIMSRFGFYSMLNHGFISIVDSSTYGTKMPRASSEFVSEMRMPIPSNLEQKAIANFLDRETQKIDTLIEKQQKMIELLKEKRQAVISHTVTKGLNPNAPMKDSGIEWLGEVPEGWTLKRLKFNFKLQSEKVEINGQPFIALENIEGGSGKFIPTDSNYTGQDVKFKHGDILFGKLRPYLAKVFECKETGVGFGDILVYRPEAHVFSRFGFYSLINDTFIRIVDSSTYGAKKPRASSEFIGEMPLTIPQFSEQKEIADYLDTQTQKIDTPIDKSQQAIELFKERKTALISAAVTGKIDVRGVA